MSNKYKYLKQAAVLVWLLMLKHTLFALKPIQLDDYNDAVPVKGEYMEYLEDPTGRLTVHDVSSRKYRSRFVTPNADEVAGNRHTNSAYWMRLVVQIDPNTQKKWIAELFDFRIDYIHAYIPIKPGRYLVYQAGSKHPFSYKLYKHKNFLFDLHLFNDRPLVLYFRIKADGPVSLVGMVRSYQRLLQHATLEYFILAFFYGVVLVMALYNLFLFIATRDVAYLYYVLYVISIGIYSLTQDGLGFEFIWGNSPMLNQYLGSIATYFIIVWALFYAQSFFHSAYRFFKILRYGTLFIFITRTGLFGLSFVYPELVYVSWIDLIPLLFIYVSGIVCWTLGYKQARFYVIAFTAFFLGFVLSMLKYFHVITENPYMVYAFNIGVLAEMVLLSMALADRIKMLTFEKEKAQKEIIVQYEEKEMLKDGINKALEAKVHERTKELEHKNKELDTFIYRSSHDIKGPLKSIIGLAAVGLEDIQHQQSRHYFEHILKSSKRLDGVVDHLLNVMDIKEATLNISRIDLKQTLYEILENIKHFSYYKEISITTELDGNLAFYSDHKMLYQIIQSLVENAYMNIDKGKAKPSLTIAGSVSEQSATIVFFDNGVGLTPELKDKIFDVFYQINASEGPQIGLYMTKIYVEKLQGSLIIDSEVGQGTTITVQLKNHNMRPVSPRSLKEKSA